jgi:hypothetical protein
MQQTTSRSMYGPHTGGTGAQSGVVRPCQQTLQGILADLDQKVPRTGLTATVPIALSRWLGGGHREKATFPQ